MVLHDLHGVLLLADGEPVLRRETQGFLADVLASRRHDRAHLSVVGGESDEDRESGAGGARLRRHPPGGGENGKIRGPSEVLLFIFCYVHSCLDRDETGSLSVLDNQKVNH